VYIDTQVPTVPDALGDTIPYLLVLRELSVNLPGRLGGDGRLHGTLELRVSQLELRAAA
jgi:hypothetical protein